MSAPAAPDRWKWKAAIIYFVLLFVFGVAAAYISSVVVPAASFAAAPFKGDGTKAYLILGAFSVVLVGPVFAALRYWRAPEFFVAVVASVGLLSGNFGGALVLSFLSLLLFCGVRYLRQIAGYYIG